MDQTTLSGKLADAQEAVRLPEVQQLIKRLSGYGLGVFMPHMHESDGSFAPLPDGMVQVEDDLQVSFHPEAEVVDDEARTYLPVGWRWSEQAQGATPVVRCTLVKQPNGTYVHVPTRVQ